jgi:hypothetical protein
MPNTRTCCYFHLLLLCLLHVHVGAAEEALYCS